ncbi:MAG: glycosyltransferase involved in cell wall biosynthesis [Desulforhopalus sp.]|jgi:glycosyltransferase involved in cell wall biosynthesis
MKLNVLSASVSRKAGGLFTSVRKLTHSLQKEGVTCQIHAFEDEYTDEDVGLWAPLEVATYTPKGFAFFPLSLPMLSTVVNSHPNIVHCHGLWLYPSIVDLIVKSKLNVPYIISPRGMLDPWAVRNSAWKKKLIGFLFENKHLCNAACIHALCQSEADAIRAYGLKNPIAVIPNGIDLAQKQEFVSAPWHDKIENGRRVLLYLGRLHPKKGLTNLVTAWKQVKEKQHIDDWTLAIAGWGQVGHEDELKEQVAALSLKRDIVFLGSQFGDAKAACYHHADAFVLPSFSEGLPMVVLEAWAHSLPVLMSPQCNIPEGFAAEAAISIKPNPDNIAAGLLSLFSMNDEDRIKMGQMGLTLVKEKFTWAKIAAEMHGVYQWVLDGGPPPDCVRFD